MKHILVLLLYAVTLCSSCAIGGEEDSSTVIYNIYHHERISPGPQLPAPETLPEKTEAPVPEVTCSGHGGRGCNGSKNCTICKNCRYCKHCAKEGGTCGVCR